MGSDACISMFNQKYWDGILIPTAIRIISGEPIPDWVQTARAERDMGNEGNPLKVKNFLEDCSVMHNLAAIDAGACAGKADEAKPRSFWYSDNNDWVCRDKACRSKSLCPFFTRKNRDNSDFFVTFEAMIETIFCPEFNDIFLRRNGSTHMYRELLDDWGVPQDAIVRDLLECLGSRGYFVGYGLTYGDGIHGWLANEECQRLSIELKKLDIPKFEGTKDGLKKMKPLGAAFKKLYREAEYTFEIRDRQWRVLTLAYLSAFAEYAAISGNGIVWINT